MAPEPDDAAGLCGASAFGLAGARRLDRDAAASGPGLERGTHVEVEAGDETFEQVEVHVAHDLRMAPGDGVERAVAHAQYAPVVIRLVPAVAQDALEVGRVLCRSGDLA